MRACVRAHDHCAKARREDGDDGDAGGVSIPCRPARDFNMRRRTRGMLYLFYFLQLTLDLLLFLFVCLFDGCMGHTSSLAIECMASSSHDSRFTAIV